MLKINLINIPSHLREGVEAVRTELDIVFSEDGIPVYIEKGDSLSVSLTDKCGKIIYSKDVEIFRALAHISREGIGCRIEEKSCFTENGLMLDVSRNGVQKVDAVKLLLRRLALMGLNLMMLYTEDTFEVEGYPYFGYMRGGYTKTELHELDDYAYSLGIEMIPCIQTLGHSSKILRWSLAMGNISDTRDVLLVGDEKTYAYIEQIMKDASEPYRSKRIHIGMDEAGGLGTGRYKALHGSEPQIDIFQKHMDRVQQIAENLGLHPMIWSDMYYASLSPKKDYDPDFHMPDDILAKIPKNVDLVYWDYYHHDYDFYTGVIREHQRTGADVLFAGGLWNWSTPAANMDFMLSTTIPALRAARDTGVSEVFTTAWGDNGTMSSVLNLLFGLQVYAEFGYTGEYDADTVDRRFSALNRANAEAYRAIGRFANVPGTDINQDLPSDITEWLLFEDPVCLYFEKETEGLPLFEHFRALHNDIVGYLDSAETDEQKLLWEFYEKLSLVLEQKCYWRENAPSCVRGNDREKAVYYAGYADTMEENAKDLYDSWYRLWHKYNTPWGWDVIDLRMGGYIARLHTASKLMHSFADGSIDTIPQMTTEKLPYAPQLSWFYRQYGGKLAHFGMIPLAQTSQDV